MVSGSVYDPGCNLTFYMPIPLKVYMLENFDTFNGEKNDDLAAHVFDGKKYG